MDAEDISCADARCAVREVLAEGRRELAEGLRDDALLVVSELTANALLHAGGVTGFSVRLLGDELHLRVSDGSREVPRRMTVPRGMPGGHGWMVVQRLCTRLHVEAEPEGKTIAAVLALRPSAPLPRVTVRW
ncbi:ATP-binding protein [Streptomyces sp. NPDC087300]|uniref:ATP-binding protein n=1 Tax=Streptomyces sp. NPDC087300 TaxID=3365780 RepID=UPI003825A703